MEYATYNYYSYLNEDKDLLGPDLSVNGWPHAYM